MSPRPRAWFWPACELSHPRRLFAVGRDECGRRTLGIRVPGGMWWIAIGPACRHRHGISFDRSACTEPCGLMHTHCIDCGTPMETCPWELA